jgi:DNA-binding transcriptional LysR family regulator
MELSQRVPSVLSFVHTAEAGSFAAAARQLGISNAAVSKNVAGLEQALGVRLLNRTTRTLSLTDEGAVFLRQARIALDALDAAVDAIATQRLEISGQVRISSSAAFGRDHLLPALPGLLASYPQLAVEVDFDDRVVDMVAGGYDLAIRGGHIADSALVARPICHLHMALVASPVYLAQAGTPQSPAELASHRLISRRFLGGKVSPWNFRDGDGSISTLDISRSGLILSAPEALTEAARQHVGIAQVGVHHAWRYLQSGELKVVLPTQHQPGAYELVLQYPHRALLAPRVKVCIDYLLAQFAATPALHVPLEALAAYAA